jgi:hypothetical protein
LFVGIGVPSILSSSIVLAIDDDIGERFLSMIGGFIGILWCIFLERETITIKFLFFKLTYWYIITFVGGIISIFVY